MTEQEITLFYNNESETIRAEAVRHIPLCHMTYKPLIDVHISIVHDKSVLVRTTLLACIIRDFEYESFEQVETFLPLYLDILEILSQDDSQEIARLAREQKKELERNRQRIREEREVKEEIEDQEL